MALYVQGNEDQFWHFCKNCSKYPSEINTTTTDRPKIDLCPECFENEQEDKCEGKTSVKPVIGII